MAFQLASALQILHRTLGCLQAFLEGPETFSPFDVVGHLIDGEETDWMTRARIILARGEPFV